MRRKCCQGNKLRLLHSEYTPISAHPPTQDKVPSPGADRGRASYRPNQGLADSDVQITKSGVKLIWPWEDWISVCAGRWPPAPVGTLSESSFVTKDRSSAKRVYGNYASAWIPTGPKPLVGGGMLQPPSSFATLPQSCGYNQHRGLLPNPPHFAKDREMGRRSPLVQHPGSLRHASTNASSVPKGAKNLNAAKTPRRKAGSQQALGRGFFLPKACDFWPTGSGDVAWRQQHFWGFFLSLCPVWT